MNARVVAITVGCAGNPCRTEELGIGTTVGAGSVTGCGPSDVTLTWAFDPETETELTEVEDLGYCK
jgi:hypothetical protein